MESVNKRIILIAVIMALFTSILIYIYIVKATAKPVDIEYTYVYVAAKTLLPKHRITEADLKQVKIARDLLNGRAVTNKAEIVGKRLRERIIEGEQIIKDRLAEDDNKLDLAYNIPEGKRAVSINVNEQIEVANLIRPGDFVDIIASFEREEYEDKMSRIVYPRITKTIIQNIQVLSLGQDRFIEADKKQELPKTVTLAVSLQDAEKLVYASEYAILRLVLRPINDDKIVNTGGAIRNDLAPDRGAMNSQK